MGSEIAIEGREISADAKELVGKGNVPSEKEAKEKFGVLIQRLRGYADSYDLLQQESLLKAVNDSVATYNSGHLDSQITALEVYIWITGGKAQAEGAMRRSENVGKLRDAQKGPPKNTVAQKKEEEEESDVEHRSVDELSADLLSAMRAKNIQGIEYNELALFLQRVSKASVEAGVSEMVVRILAARRAEISQSPEKATLIVKVMISGIKAIFNQAEYLQEKPFLVFDERTTKTAILIEKNEKNNSGREIMSTNEGRISGVTVILAATGEFGEGHYHILTQLMEAKKNEPQFVLTCVYSKETERENFLRYLKEANIQFPPPRVDFAKAREVMRKDTGNAISGPEWLIWARDGAVRRKNGTIVEPKRFRERNPLGMDAAYDAIAPLQGTDLEQSELSFEGGNVRAGSNYVLVGFDCIDRTARDLQKQQEKKYPTDQRIQDAIQRFEKEFGKRVVVIGLKNRNQPVYHIDMCITPLDDRTMAVAKPVFGKDKMKHVCEQLQQEGFSIVRVPYAELPDAGLVGTGVDSTDVYVSYNNALVERYRSPEGKDIRRIYLPQYYAGTKENPVYSFNNGARQIDLARMNAEAEDVYRKQGLEVIPIHISVSVISKEGSLNCLTFEQREEK